MRSFSPSRQAFTLMELMIVMALIVIIAGISIPVIQTMMTDSRITASGDMVRGRLADTRAKALEEGRPWRLAYLPGTGILQLAAEDSLEWGNADRDPVERLDLIRDELPTEIVFAKTHEEIMNSQGGGGGASGSWETIAIFMADGSARDDGAVYFGKPGMGPMRARIRGLTGGVTIETYMQFKANP